MMVNLNARKKVVVEDITLTLNEEEFRILIGFFGAISQLDIEIMFSQNGRMNIFKKYYSDSEFMFTAGNVAELIRDKIVAPTHNNLLDVYDELMELKKG